MSDQDAVAVARLERARAVCHYVGVGPCEISYSKQDHVKLCDHLSAAILAFADAEARGLAARDGTLSREDVVAWLDSVAGDVAALGAVGAPTLAASMRTLSQEVRAGMVEAWLASRAKSGGL